MPWSRSRPGGSKTAAKYRDPVYLAEAKRLRHQLKREGSGICAEVVCLMRSRLITPSMRLHVCHDRATGEIRGLGHMKCNVTEAARFARSMQNVIRIRL
jgi:hypothetical protein